MARNGDVMRSDRLKQVMQQIDPNFDERNAGFNRFSKFVIEAGHKGVVLITKSNRALPATIYFVQLRCFATWPRWRC